MHPSQHFDMIYTYISKYYQVSSLKGYESNEDHKVLFLKFVHGK